MTIHPVNRLRRSAAGVVLGFVTLVLVAALLAGAAAAVRAANTIDTLVADLNDARDQIARLQVDNDRLAQQNRQILRQNRILVRELRRHGLTIPQVVIQTPPASSESSGVGATSPKATPTAPPPPTPRQSSRPTPRPTTHGTPTPNPSAPSTVTPLGLVCTLVRPLCQPLAE